MDTNHSNIKVFVVDDCEIMRLNLKKILYKLGVKSVIEACDGVDATKKITSEEISNAPFDMIFLDWNMPLMNGLEFLKFCKSEDSLKKIPIIMTTAESERTSVMQALKDGAQAYILKPYRLFIIQEKFEQALATIKKAS
jgi:two-component system, chemotaxis family, chemotaxis protein CheY